MNYKTAYLAWMAGTVALLIAGSNLAPGANGVVRMPNRPDRTRGEQDTPATLFQRSLEAADNPTPDLMLRTDTRAASARARDASR